MGRMSPLVRSNSLKRRANAGISSAATLAAYVGLHGSVMRQLIVHSIANANLLPIGTSEVKGPVQAFSG